MAGGTKRKLTEARAYSDLGLNRYRLTLDEEQMLNTYRNEKTVLSEECKGAGIDIESVKHWWYKSKRISAFVKPTGKTLQELKEELLKDLSKYSPKFPAIKRVKYKDSYCLVIDPADIHIGKLASAYETGEDYNNEIAVKRVNQGIEKILSYVQCFPLDKIVLIIGNDILHTDNAKRTTTSGTPQDTDGQWYDNFIIAKNLYIGIIDKLVNIADLHIIHNVSNHDYMAGWYLAETIKTYYRNCKNISFDTNMRHRKAYRYHSNLIGTTHGDGAKTNDLPLLMAQEFKKEWAETQHRYIYVHHVHHKNSKEMIGVTVESVRSPSGNDGWHHRNGYQYAAQAIEAYLHCKVNGQIARFTAIVI